jgi:hypothetical protein
LRGFAAPPLTLFPIGRRLIQIVLLSISFGPFGALDPRLRYFEQYRHVLRGCSLSKPLTLRRILAKFDGISHRMST